MPSTFPESPGLGYGALWHLEMLSAAFWDSEGNVGSQGRDSAPQGGGDVSGRLRSGSGGSWRASRRCCWMSFAPEGMGVRRAKLCRLGKLQEQGNLGNIPGPTSPDNAPCGALELLLCPTTPTGKQGTRGGMGTEQGHLGHLIPGSPQAVPTAEVWGGIPIAGSFC